MEEMLVRVAVGGKRCAEQVWVGECCVVSSAELECGNLSLHLREISFCFRAQYFCLHARCTRFCSGFLLTVVFLSSFYCYRVITLQIFDVPKLRYRPFPEG